MDPEVPGGSWRFLQLSRALHHPSPPLTTSKIPILSTKPFFLSSSLPQPPVHPWGEGSAGFAHPRSSGRDKARLRRLPGDRGTPRECLEGLEVLGICSGYFTAANKLGGDGWRELGKYGRGSCRARVQPQSWKSQRWGSFCGSKGFEGLVPSGNGSAQIIFACCSLGSVAGALPSHFHEVTWRSRKLLSLEKKILMFQKN